MEAAIPQEWLRRKVETRDFVELATVEFKELGFTPSARDMENIQRGCDKWQEFISQESNGDELWAFTSDPQS